MFSIFLDVYDKETYKKLTVENIIDYFKDDKNILDIFIFNANDRV